jgi:adenosylmethionine-8-amino-7-oxononanoate aminotransferase
MSNKTNLFLYTIYYYNSLYIMSTGETMVLDDYIKHLIESDRRYIWHPFTQMQDWSSEEPIIVTEGHDCFLKDVRGRWYLDGVSSLWVNIHGHRKKELDRAIMDQLGLVAHSTLLGAGNVPSIRLAEKLAALMEQSFGKHSLSKVFYSDNGSTAVEVALKMAFQYWQHKGVKGKERFLSLQNAYHGDTLGAVSVGGIDIFHEAFRPLLFDTFKAPSPYCYRCGLSVSDASPERCGMLCLSEMEKMLKAHHGEIAAVIIEPLIQGAGGMLTSPQGYLKGVRDLCTRYGVLMIADEVATGFGRTGKMFACQHEGVVPDIICLSKGITGGYMPLAATIATGEVYSAFLGEFSELKTFFHGHSYTGNPLACACALACLDVFEKEHTLVHLQPKTEVLDRWLEKISDHPHVGDARGVGLMAGVELVRDKETKESYAWEEKMGWQVAYAAREGGVLIRPLGNVVVIMPPLAIGEKDLRRMLEVIEEAIGKATENQESKSKIKK